MEIRQETIDAMNIAKKLVCMEETSAFATICYCIEAIAAKEQLNPVVYAETCRCAIRDRLSGVNL